MYDGFQPLINPAIYMYAPNFTCLLCSSLLITAIKPKEEENIRTSSMLLFYIVELHYFNTRNGCVSLEDMLPYINRNPVVYVANFVPTSQVYTSEKLFRLLVRN
jgi:hypothetical protein